MCIMQALLAVDFDVDDVDVKLTDAAAVPVVGSAVVRRQ